MFDLVAHMPRNFGVSIILLCATSVDVDSVVVLEVLLTTMQSSGLLILPDPLSQLCLSSTDFDTPFLSSPLSQVAETKLNVGNRPQNRDNPDFDKAPKWASPNLSTSRDVLIATDTCFFP